MLELVIATVVLVGLGAGPAGSLELSDSKSESVELDPAVFRPVLVPGGSLISRGIRVTESESYYRVLDHARRVDGAELKAAASRFLSSRREASKDAATRRLPVDEFPVFVDLYNNVGRPEVYLGKPLTVRGHVRRVVEMPAGENDFGIEVLYEVWLFTADGQQHPVVLVVTSVPAGLLEEVARLQAADRPVAIDGVSGSGYFFKMYGYPAGDAYRFAPLVLGGTLDWSPVPEGGLDQSLPLVLAIGLVAFGLPIGWFVWKNRIEDRQRRAGRLANVPESFDWDAAESEAEGVDGVAGVSETEVDGLLEET